MRNLNDEKLNETLASDLSDMEQKLMLEHPGVAAVLELHERVLQSVHQVATFTRATADRATFITSNGSAL